MPRTLGRTGSIRTSLDLVDKLESQAPTNDDLIAFFDETDARAKQTALSTLLSSLAPVTATSATPATVTAATSGSTFTNEGAAAQIEFDLPTAVAGLKYTFFVQDSDGMKIVANTGDTISIDGVVSAAAGNIVSSIVGDFITLIAINVTEWVAIARAGNWFIT